MSTNHFQICIKEMYVTDAEFKSYVDLIKDAARLPELAMSCSRNFEEFLFTNLHIETYFKMYNSDDISSVFFILKL